MDSSWTGITVIMPDGETKLVWLQGSVMLSQPPFEVIERAESAVTRKDDVGRIVFQNGHVMSYNEVREIAEQVHRTAIVYADGSYVEGFIRTFE